jgi:hypothetical protein
MQMLSALARDAAELLWEMVVMDDSGASILEMHEKAKQLQVRGNCKSESRALLGVDKGAAERALRLSARAHSTSISISRRLLHA